MPQRNPAETDADFLPLSGSEQGRLRSALHSVSTRSLLQSLLSLTRESEDAQLIIAALLDRLQPPVAEAAAAEA